MVKHLLNTNVIDTILGVWTVNIRLSIDSSEIFSNLIMLSLLSYGLKAINSLDYVMWTQRVLCVGMLLSVIFICS